MRITRTVTVESTTSDVPKTRSVGPRTINSSKKEPGFGQGFLLLFKLLDGRLESHRDTTRGVEEEIGRFGTEPSVF